MVYLLSYDYAILFLLIYIKIKINSIAFLNVHLKEPSQRFDSFTSDVLLIHSLHGQKYVDTLQSRDPHALVEHVTSDVFLSLLS